MSSVSGGGGATTEYYCVECGSVFSGTPSADLVCLNCESRLLMDNPFSDPTYPTPGTLGGGVPVVMNSDSSFPHVPSLADYDDSGLDGFLGQGSQQSILQLNENDSNRRGAPPASKAAVEDLPDIMITEELLDSDSIVCGVCQNSLNPGQVVKQMPCMHLFHNDCILRWLQERNSCPVCRFQLPTDDPDYENQRNEQQQEENPNLRIDTITGLVNRGIGTISVLVNQGIGTITGLVNQGVGTITGLLNQGIGTITGLVNRGIGNTVGLVSGNQGPMPSIVDQTQRIGISAGLGSGNQGPMPRIVERTQWLLREGAVGGNGDDGGSSGQAG
ncbi:ubiquitin-protein ligase [Lithospermum erythrorhizon]|uniref:RING-type E3 ubiquitin transferase n=1 Tax=Lithospermum erythrorhizon TaxID=34254 RepID=A0AAV3RMM7_LITER